MINDGLPPSVRLSALRQFGMMLLAVVACCVEQTVAKAFPAEIEHRFGVARITKQPKRVVSISLIGHDFLLALDVKPVGLRRWYGSHPFGVWPWAQDQLGDAKPAVMQGEIDIERVALLRPDLIEAQWSGMTAREYHLLSQIAPTLGPAKGAGDYGTSWMEMLRRLGAATGHTRKADQVIDRIEGRFRAIRKANPAWLGATATMSWAGAIGAYRR
ncbi:MAG: ABC transporter substrate-binding protein, partial [Pseudomonadota bacterium]